MADRDYVYVWVDGVHFTIRLGGKRDLDWLRRWIKNPTAMLATASLAKALLAQSPEHGGIAMPNMRVSKEETEALIHYIASQSRK